MKGILQLLTSVWSIKKPLNLFMKQNEQIKQPFFVKFLESQRINGTQDQNSITKPWLDIHETQKYPSDGDEGDPSIVD